MKLDHQLERQPNSNPSSRLNFHVSGQLDHQPERQLNSRLKLGYQPNCSAASQIAQPNCSAHKPKQVLAATRGHPSALFTAW
jgi:hypothetical protein